MSRRGIMRKPTLLIAAIGGDDNSAGAPGRVPGGHNASTARPERGELVVTGKPDLEWRDPAPEDSMDIQSIATLPGGERIGEVYQPSRPTRRAMYQPRTRGLLTSTEDDPEGPS
jgi:hypothetical protein